MAGSSIGIQEADPDFLKLVGHLSREQMATILYEYFSDNRKKFAEYISIYHGKGGYSLVDYKDLRTHRKRSSSWPSHNKSRRNK